MQGSLRNRLAFLLAAGGIGLCAYAGLQWRQLPHYSEADLEISTELNLQIDLARQSVKEPFDPERMGQLRRQERADIQTEIESGRTDVLHWLAAGLALLTLAGGQLMTIRLNIGKQ